MQNSYVQAKEGVVRQKQDNGPQTDSTVSVGSSSNFNQRKSFYI